MAGRRVSCGVFGEPGARRFACVEPPYMQRAIQTGDGRSVARYDSEDECERECNALAMLPPEIAEQLGTYLPLPALAAMGRAARVGGPVVGSALERAACRAIAERFPEAWRLLLAGAAPGGAIRADPGRLAQLCRAWNVTCAARPCAALLARMSDTFSVTLADEDVDEPDEVVLVTDLLGGQWSLQWYTVRSLSDERFLATPGNAPFYAHPAPVRSLYGVGDALPVFLPGNTVHVDAAELGTASDLWGVVDGVIRAVTHDVDTGLLTFHQATMPARTTFRTTTIAGQGQGTDTEWMELVFEMPPPPGVAARPGEHPLAAARRYADYANDVLGAGLFAARRQGVIRVAAEASEAATRYFAAHGFPASEIRAHALEPVWPPPG